MARIPVNAIKELMLRVFAEFTVELNIQPPWLINPDTNRRLKLDFLMPEIGVAVYFDGLTARQQKRRLSMQEELAWRDRNRARVSVCAANDIDLANLNLSTENYRTIFETLDETLSRASRRLKSETPPNESLLNKLRRARAQNNEYRRTIETDRDLGLYNELWRDRQFKATRQRDVAQAAAETVHLVVGQLLEHSHFGLGIVQTVTPSGDDQIVTVQFGDDDDEDVETRTFMASLLADKIEI